MESFIFELEGVLCFTMCACAYLNKDSINNMFVSGFPIFLVALAASKVMPLTSRHA